MDSQNRSSPARKLRYFSGSDANPDNFFFPNRLWDLVIPISVLVLGIAIFTGVLIWWKVSLRNTSAWFTGYVLFRAIILVLLLPILTKATGNSFGPLPAALLKLAAISVFPEAVILLVSALWGPCFGLTAGLLIAMVIGATMYVVFFEMDLREGGFCVMLTWAGSIIGNGILWWIIKLFFGV